MKGLVPVGISKEKHFVIENAKDVAGGDVWYPLGADATSTMSLDLIIILSMSSSTFTKQQLLDERWL